jgi:hypothetical protein
MPHVFVTWQVAHVFKGRLATQSFSTRFLGGKPNDDELLLLQRAPQPDVGDHDVVFVQRRRSGRSICPLVRCRELGRLRIFGGAVYGEQGNEMTVGSDGGLRRGPRHEFPAVMQWEAAGITRVVGPQGGDADSAPDTTTSSDTPPGPAMSVETLRTLLDARMHALYTPRQLRRPRLVKSLDLEARFKFRIPKAKKMTRGAVVDPTSPPLHGAVDHAEHDAFVANSRNPVLAH